jgi:hypothetical protein
MWRSESLEPNSNATSESLCEQKKVWKAMVSTDEGMKSDVNRGSYFSGHSIISAADT